MSDDQQQSNPLEHKIESVEELVKDTKVELDEVSRLLQEAEESGNLEAFLKTQKKPKE